MPHEQILVRFGWQATVGKFSFPATESSLLDSDKSACFERGARVIVHSPRGTEIGCSLGLCQQDNNPMGSVVRLAQPEDEIIDRQLQLLSKLALHRCHDWLEENGHGAVLLEVEPLYDGQTLYFHFLSGVDDILQHQVEQLAELYEREVTESDFAKKIQIGCGPGCGTETASGRNCSNCSKCKICVSHAGSKV